MGFLFYYRGSPLTDCICREKTKTTIFENVQFSGHFVLEEKMF